MTFDGRYVANEVKFLESAFVTFSPHFSDRAAFDNFYEKLHGPELRDEFLRITNFYRYLVKEGDWQIRGTEHNPVIDYLTNTYKLVALFSLIESLTTLKHEDFYEWLCHKKATEIFPIQDQNTLQMLYQDYKKSFGSIRRCVVFFDRLPSHLQGQLCDSIHINGKPIQNIKKVAEFLYNLRSKFVHEGKLVLSVADTPVYSIGEKKKRLMRSSLTISLLLEAFEVGVLEYFRSIT